MTKTDTYYDETPAATETGRLRPAPRRWWRALDRMTLQTMNPPVPAHVRAARPAGTDGIRPDRGQPTN